MKKVIFGVLAAVALVSCSNDELLEQNRVNDEITFSAAVNKPLRAENVYCNNNMPSEFTVWGAFEGKTYMDGDDFIEVNGVWKNADHVRYWPNEGQVNFFAHVNGENNFVWDATAAPKFVDYEVPTDVAAQKDLLYAVKTAAKSETAVGLNFHHALSQVIFCARNKNANLYVEIEGVKVCNVGNVNTFTYPTKDSDGNIVDHKGAFHVLTYDEGWGEWEILNGGTTTYPVSFSPVAVVGNNEKVSLTAASEIPLEYNRNAMLLLPQKTTKWDIDAEATPANQAGTYFLLNCMIYNVAGTDVDKATDVCLWGEKDGSTYKAKELALPVDFYWEQGKKYIYTFVFGEGNGGFDPDPEDPNTPDPVLVPITFDVTVDDFIEVSDVDVETGIPGIINP